MSKPTRLSAQEFANLEGLDDWRIILDGIQAEFAAGSFDAGAALVVDIATAAEAADHHPDIDLRYPGRVRVRLSTHSVNGLSRLDADLAHMISALAADAGAKPQPSTAQTVEVAIDTMDADRIRPFWAAVLDYRDNDGTLVDPRGSGPPFWFQQMDEPRTDRDRFHIDVSVPAELADARVQAVIAAGGRLVTDDHARSWWVLADADGNEACVCTWQDRTS